MSALLAGALLFPLRSSRSGSRGPVASVASVKKHGLHVLSTAVGIPSLYAVQLEYVFTVVGELCHED